MRSLKLATTLLGLGLVSLAYLALKLGTLGLSDTDENIYFYGIKLVLEGQVPYRDFFFAHPPLHLLLPALPLVFTGFSLGFLKLCPLLASMLSGLLLFDAVRRSEGLLGGFAALLLFWFSLEQLQASTNLTGVNLTVAFLALAFWAFGRGWQLASGLALGLALCTGVYGLALLPALLLALAWAAPARLPRWLLGLALGFLPLQLLFLGLAGEDFLQQVYGYHLAKPPRSGGFQAPGGLQILGLAAVFGLCFLATLGRRQLARSGTRQGALLRWVLPPALLMLFTWVAAARQGTSPLGLLWGNLGVFLLDPVAQRMAYQHLPLLFLGLASPLILLLPRKSPLDPPQPEQALLPLAAALALLLFLLQFSMLRETFTFYYLLLILPASLAGAGALARGLGILSQSVLTLIRRRQRPALVPLLAALGFFALLALAWPAAQALGRHRFPEESRNAGQQRCYHWREASPSPLSGLARSLFWRDCRTVGDLDPAPARYLWNKQKHFSTAPEIAAYIKANSLPDETLAGASTVAPLLALLADRRLSGNLIDTNARRFKTGSLDWPAFWQTVCSQPLRFLVAMPNTYMSPRALAANPVVRRWFRVDRIFQEPELSHGGQVPVVLFRRLDPPPSPAGPWCLPAPENEVPHAR